MKDMNWSMIKMKALQEQFAIAYPFLKKHVWLFHFAKFFWLSRQSLYCPEQIKESKRQKLADDLENYTKSDYMRKKFNKKFLEHLLSLKK